MELSVRRPPYIIPSYSLTGDLLSFLRCGLQYRYEGLGRLPATRPAQMWFGQFIHGVLEESYRRYRRNRDDKKDPLIPDDVEIEEILRLIDRRLAAGGLRPRNADLERVGYQRARVAVSQLGPELFPIISEAEIPLNGTRRLPFEEWPRGLRRRESDRYEMAGVVDVITEIQLDDPALADNRIVRAVIAALPQVLPAEFEVIVDYKGMRRPPIIPDADLDFWQIYAWQLQTYAMLRSVQAQHRQVVAGILVFLNELSPTPTDIATLRREIRKGHTDVVPDSPDRKLLSAWRDKQPAPDLSYDFRLARALRIISIDSGSQEAAADHFDEVVFNIELLRAREGQSSAILNVWPPNSSDESTCVACDRRTICPEYPAIVPSLPIDEA